MKRTKTGTAGGAVRWCIVCLSAAILLGCSTSTTVIDLSMDSAADRGQLQKQLNGTASVTTMDNTTVRGSVALEGDFLRVYEERHPAGITITIALQDLKELRFKRWGDQRRGKSLGAIFGGVVGAISGVTYIAILDADEVMDYDIDTGTYFGSAGVGAVSLGLIGAVVGAVIGGKETVVLNLAPDIRYVLVGRQE